MVRITITFGYCAINVTAEASLENSAYASSTTSNPPTAAVAFANSTISEVFTTEPVGLFGVVIKVRVGFADTTC